MHKIGSPAPAEGKKSRKVHPQSSSLAECGCPKSRDLDWPKEAKQEKCIRKGTDCRDADAQNRESHAGGRNQTRKSASAKVLTVGMRMPNIQSPRPAEGNKIIYQHSYPTSADFFLTFFHDRSKICFDEEAGMNLCLRRILSEAGDREQLRWGVPRLYRRWVLKQT